MDIIFNDFKFLQTIYLTFKISFITTLILLPIGISIGYFLAYSKKSWTSIIEVLVWMPLILPPSVIGFYLLVLFSPNNAIGEFLIQKMNLQLVFTTEGIIFASVIFSLPFMVNPIKNGFSLIPQSIKYASYTLGRGELYTTIFVLIPNIKSHIILGSITSFVHTIGEFGVVMMVGGNIVGKTRMASIAIYEEVESINFALAHAYSLILFATTFILLLIIFFIVKKQDDKNKY